MGTEDAGRRQTEQKHNTENWKDEQHGTQQNTGVNSGAGEG